MNDIRNPAKDDQFEALGSHKNKMLPLYIIADLYWVLTLYVCTGAINSL